MKSQSADPSGTLLQFARVADSVGATTKKKEKVKLISDFLLTLSEQEACVAAIFLTGRPFAAWEERVLGVGGMQLSAVVADVAQLESAELGLIYRKYGDLGDAAADALRNRNHDSRHSLTEVATQFDDLAKSRTRASKAELLRTFFESAAPPEVKYLIKIISGDLRIGLKESLVEEAIAQAYARSLDSVRRANMLLGDIGETLKLAAHDKLSTAAVRFFHPLGMMLAAPVQTAEELHDEIQHGLIAEEKYDGIRAQVHKHDGRIRMFSRTLDELSEFPELAASFLALPGNFILDGEILAWDDSGPLPFTTLQQRLGKKIQQATLFDSAPVPVKYVAFDVLFSEGQLLLDAVLKERRQFLDRLLDGQHSSALRLAPVWACDSVEAVETAFRNSLSAGHEGIVVKKLDSPYVAGRRGGYWFKLKEPFATLDVVVTAVEYGHGRRHNVLSDYTFAVRSGEEFLNIGKAYSGLTDAEITEYSAYFKKHVVKDEGWRLIVEPRVVIEVAFNNIQRSERHASGYALRFPRILRLRTDKPVSEIDTLDVVKAHFAAQFKERGEYG